MQQSLKTDCPKLVCTQWMNRKLIHQKVFLLRLQTIRECIHPCRHAQSQLFFFHYHCSFELKPCRLGRLSGWQAVADRQAMTVAWLHPEKTGAGGRAGGRVSGGPCHCCSNKAWVWPGRVWERGLDTAFSRTTCQHVSISTKALMALCGHVWAHTGHERPVGFETLFISISISIHSTE